MAITGIGNSDYTSYTAELKTSTPGVTRKEQIGTGYSNVNDYSKYLQGKYSYMNSGTTSMQGIPTTVSVSSAFLQKCMNNPEKAAYLEENLAAIPDCVKSAVNGCLGTLTNLSYQIDASGNITVMGSGTSDPDGKIARENAERKAQENREKEKKIKEKRATKREEEEKALKRKEAKERAQERVAESDAGSYTIGPITGNNAKSVTESILLNMSVTAGSFEAKA